MGSSVVVARTIAAIILACWVCESVFASPTHFKNEIEDKSKRAFDSLASRGFTGGFNKRAFDSFVGAGFRPLDKRSFDSFLGPGFNPLEKRAFDSFAGSFSGMDRKRAFDSISARGFGGFD